MTSPKITPKPFEVFDSYNVPSVQVKTLRFQLPLNYRDPASSETIAIAVKVLTGPKSTSEHLLYLQGGPGYESPTPVDDSQPAFFFGLLERGFTVVLLDQRGTGFSSALDVNAIVSRGTPEEQLEFVTYFRQDYIVFDAETIRCSLLKDEKWTILGQSYGGFCSVCYLSRYPDSLKKVLIAAGLPPLTGGVVGAAKNNLGVAETNTRAFYTRFPQDEAHVTKIIKHLCANRIPLPTGGILSVSRFRQLGTLFAVTRGPETLHLLILSLITDLEARGRFSYKTLKGVQDVSGFETNVLHFLFQEAIYMNGPGHSSDWTVHRMLSERTNREFFFTSEHHYPDVGDDYGADIAKLAPLLGLMHKYKSWPLLWDMEGLSGQASRSVPVSAAVFEDDQYVSRDLSLANSALFPFQSVVLSGYLHDGLNEHGEKMLEHLFK